MEIETVALDDLISDRRIQFREGPLDPAWVAKFEALYLEGPDVPDPPDVFELVQPEQGYEEGDRLVAAGHHRSAGARSAGLTEIPVRIRKGTFEQAREFAALSNTRHGKPYTKAEQRKLLFFLHEIHPKWNESRLARETAIHRDTINGILRALGVKEALGARGVGIPTDVTESHLNEIGRLPEDLWEPTIKAAAWQRWTVRDTKAWVKRLLDPHLGEVERSAILGSTPEPEATTEPATASDVGTVVSPTPAPTPKPTPIEPAEPAKDEPPTVLTEPENEPLLAEEGAEEEPEDDEEALRRNVRLQRHNAMDTIERHIGRLEDDKAEFVADVSDDDIKDLHTFAQRLTALANVWYDGLHPQQQVAQ
jgi:ParB-like chromosome segregation protein Spo0J